MNPDFWFNRWKKNEIAFHQEAINPVLQQHWPSLRRDKGSTVFVPLCGKSRDMLWLRDQGHEVLGVELSTVALQDFFVENNLTPQATAQPPFVSWQAPGIKLLLGDFFKLTANHLAGVTAVYDRASLIALPPSMRADYVAKLAEILPANTETLLLSITYPQAEMQGPPFSVPEEEVRSLYSPHYQVERLGDKSILNESPRFRERGLTQLTEQVYRLRRTSRLLNSQ